MGLANLHAQHYRAASLPVPLFPSSLPSCHEKRQLDRPGMASAVSSELLTNLVPAEGLPSCHEEG
eukprot:2598416-Alexandrium_andersonii.AAC.1